MHGASDDAVSGRAVCVVVVVVAWILDEVRNVRVLAIRFVRQRRWCGWLRYQGLRMRAWRTGWMRARFRTGERESRQQADARRVHCITTPAGVQTSQVRS